MYLWRQRTALGTPGVKAGGEAAPDYLMTFASGNPESAQEVISQASVDSRYFTDGFIVEFDITHDSTLGSTRWIFRQVTPGEHLNTVNGTWQLRHSGGTTNLPMAGSYSNGDSGRIEVDFLAGTFALFINGVEDANSPASFTGDFTPADVTVNSGNAGFDVYQPTAI